MKVTDTAVAAHELQPGEDEPDLDLDSLGRAQA
jgi:hypothetical protein